MLTLIFRPGISLLTNDALILISNLFLTNKVAMKTRFAKVLATSLSLIASYNVYAQPRLNVSITNVGNNRIEIRATASGDFTSTVPAANFWTEMSITWRIPKAVTVPQPTVNPSSPAPTPEIADEATEFTGGEPRDVFSEDFELTIFDRTTFGGEDDGYWYFQITGTAGGAMQDIANGESLLIYTFTVPAQWSCPACVEILLLDDPVIPLGTISHIDNGNYGDVFNLVTNFAPLPVRFENFTAKKAASGVLLTWKVASEENTKRYHIERSVDGSAYEDIGSVVPRLHLMGNTYTYTDRNPSDGNNYYRIKQLDENDNFTYSATRMTRFPFAGNVYVSLYPVPVYSSLTVNIKSATKEKVSLRLTDIMGRVILFRQIDVGPSVMRQVIETANLEAGLYFISISGRRIRWSNKFIKR